MSGEAPRREYGMARTQRMSLAVSKGELRQIKENAAWFGMEVAEYARYAMLGGTVEPPALSERAHRRSGGEA